MEKMENLQRSRPLYGRIAQIFKIETADGFISGKSG